MYTQYVLQADQLLDSVPVSVTRIPGYVLTDHVVEVPLDHRDPGAETIEVFAREVVAADREDEDLPWLRLPAGRARRQGRRARSAGDGWLGQALKTHRVCCSTSAAPAAAPRSRAADGAIGSADASWRRTSRCFRADTSWPTPSTLRHDGRRRRAVVDARPELRRVPHADLPVAGARGAARLLRHRRPARPDRDRRRGLRAHLSRGSRPRTREFYRRYPRRRRAVGRDRRPPGRARRPAAGRRPADRPAAAVARHRLRDEPGYERMHWLLDEALARRRAVRRRSCTR